MPFEYEPLLAENAEIRVIQILPPKIGTTAPSYRLSVVSLDASVGFYALSYAWGEQKDRVVSEVDGCEISIPRNLCEALQYLAPLASTLDPEPFLLWADAICINQNDLKEKAQQIPMMGRIFSSALMVFAYLGRCSPKAEHAVQLLHEVEDRLDMVHGGDGQDQEVANGADRICQRTGVHPDEGSVTRLNAFWDGIIEIVRSPVWSRAWILQEMVFASRLHLFFGDVTKPQYQLRYGVLVQWGHFLDRMRRIGWKLGSKELGTLWKAGSDKFHRNVAGRIHVPASLRALVRCAPEDRNRMLSQALDNFYFYSIIYNATDARDLVYAFTSLFELDIEVDYSEDMPVARLYWLFARLCVEKGQCGQVLFVSGLGWNPTNEFDLPSWVPDWKHLRWMMDDDHDAPCIFPLIGAFMVSEANNGMPARSYRPRVCQMSLQTQGCVLEILDMEDVLVLHPNEPACIRENLESLHTFCSRFAQSKVWFRDFTKHCRLKVLLGALLYGVQRYGQFEGGKVTRLGDEDLHVQVITAYTFLACLISPFERQSDKSLKRARELDYDDKVESPKEFFIRSFFPQMRGSAEFGNIIDVLFEDLNLDRALFPSLDEFEKLRTIKYLIFHIYSTPLIEIKQGYGLAMVPPATRKGDPLCIVAHCNYPVILRESGSGYLHVGPCFVPGYMDGAAAGLLASGAFTMQEFMIQ